MNLEQIEGLNIVDYLANMRYIALVGCCIMLIWHLVLIDWISFFINSRMPKKACASGLVVKFILAMDEPPVQFRASAFLNKLQI